MKDNKILLEKDNQKNLLIKRKSHFESELSKNLNKYIYGILISIKSLVKLEQYFLLENIDKIKNFYDNFYNNIEFIYSKQLYNIEKIEKFPSIFIINEETWNSMIPPDNSKILETYKGEFGNQILLIEISNHNNNTNKLYVFFFLWGKNILRQGYIKIKQLSKEKEIINSLKVNSPLNFFKNNNIKINGNKCFENLINFDIVIQECITINKKNNANSFLKLNNINNLKDNNNLTFSKILKGVVVDKKKKRIFKNKRKYN